MASHPWWKLGTSYHHSHPHNNCSQTPCIDLTEDDDEQDELTETQALLEKFTKSKPSVVESEPRPLKRKSPHDSSGGQHPVNGLKTFDYRPASNGANNRVIGEAVWPRTPIAAVPLQEIQRVKVEARYATPASLSPDLAQLQPHDQNNRADFTSVSSKSESLKTRSREQSTRRHTQSPSVHSTSFLSNSDLSSRSSNVMVIVPPPPPSTSSGPSEDKMSQIIHRLLFDSSESEESDPDEPKGTKSKYYPVNMHDIQADRGRYPQARTTRKEPAFLPTPPPLTTASLHKTQPKARHSQKNYLRNLLEKKLRSIQGPPVRMARDWDGTGSLASNFEFTNSYKLQKGVERVPDDFILSCSCKGHCDPLSCQCLSREEDSEELMVPYEYRNGKLLLKENFIDKTAMIYECTSRCDCAKSCWNRLVQHGRKIGLEIFHTGSRGFGLRSTEYIHRGQFIDTYLGEVITSAEADLREEAANSQNSASYLFSLDWFPPTNDDEADEEEGNNPYVVDGQRFGGPSRFMNHSCNPNCRMFPVSTHQADNRIYDLAFFAIRDIPPGIELTFDYNPSMTGTAGEIDADPSAVKCLCGEVKCRGQLWPNQRKSSNI